MAGSRLHALLLWTLAIYGLQGARAFSVSDLPEHPQVNCATGAVKAAFTTCAFGGASTACCQGLDAVFANSTSPSNGCLCYPQVLYKTIVRASKSGLDVLSLLASCNRRHGDSFHTQWAAAEPTLCPAIPLSATAADMITLMGDSVILPGSRSRPTWAWSNVLQFGEVNQSLTDIDTVWQQLFGLHTVQLLLLVIISVGPLFLLMHSAVLSRSSTAYNALPPSDRFVACQHSVYAVVFSLSVIPQTVLAFTAMFKAWTGNYFDSSNLPALCGLFLASRAMLYLVELSARIVIKRSWLLIVHHQLFFLIIVMGIWTHNTAVLGIGIVLDLFACHEAPLYLGLLAYRLQVRPAITRGILQVACAWYILTRVFQTAMIMYMVFGFARMPAVRTRPEFIVTALLFGAFTVIQAYTLVIYAAMYRKVSRRSADEQFKQAPATANNRASNTGVTVVTVSQA